VFALIIGLVTAWVAWALSKGNDFARFLVSLVQVLNIGNQIWTWIQLGGNYVISAIINIAIAVVILVLVWNRRASEFFASR
jgi:tryptophan-rich sensory protein